MFTLDWPDTSLDWSVVWRDLNNGEAQQSWGETVTALVRCQAVRGTNMSSYFTFMFPLGCECKLSFSAGAELCSWMLHSASLHRWLCLHGLRLLSYKIQDGVFDQAIPIASRTIFLLIKQRNEWLKMLVLLFSVILLPWFTHHANFVKTCFEPHVLARLSHRLYDRLSVKPTLCSRLKYLCN